MVSKMVNKKYDQLYIKLNQKTTAFLLLGQDYLRLNSGKDHFLTEILRKYNNGVEPTGYNQILEGEAHNNSQSSLAWMQERCNRFSPPEWLVTVASFLWNGVYTSAIDVIWLKAFRSQGRDLQSIYDLETYNPLDPRNRSRLHCTFLFGCVNKEEENKRPPLEEFEFTDREPIAISLVRKLPELITPMGVLIIEGYAGERDWLSPQNLYAVVNALNPGQTHIFSVTEDIKNNRFISKLVNLGKLIMHDESLESYFLLGEENGLIRLGESPEVEENGRRIQIENEVLEIPLSLWNQVSRSAIILDDTVLVEPEYISPDSDRQYSEFRRFLAESSIKPLWSGYHRGFAFQRDFEKTLHTIVTKKIKANDLHNSPIILHGQPGTGKSVALGCLAYLFRTDKKYPVLFIERKSQMPSITDINTFCEWVEKRGVSTTLLIWDGMVEQKQYYEFSRKLASLGRKVLIVGSCYKIKDINSNQLKSTFIEAPAILNLKSNSNEETELLRFIRFIKKFAEPLAEISEKLIRKYDNRFLVALYRLLPDTRSQIRDGLIQEVRFFEDKIHKVSQDKAPNLKTNMAIAFAILQDKPKWLEQDMHDAFSLKTRETFSNENVSKIQKIIGLIMVPGKLGLNVPLDILMRAIDKEGVTNFVEIINKLNTDIITWYSDQIGNYQIGARHSLEAEQITNSFRGSIQAEVDYAKELLINVRDRGGWDTELQFALDLLKKMGPNSPIDYKYFSQYFEDISDTLTKLRQEHSIVNPRLMLQEAMFLRESATNKSEALSSNANTRDLSMVEKMFDKAKSVIDEALKLVGEEKRNKKTRSVLYGELSSILGAKFQHILKQDYQRSIPYFEEAKNIAFQSFYLDSEEYHPIDVLSWTTKAFLNHNNWEPELIAKSTADILQAFTMVEIQDFDPVQQVKFQTRREQIGQLIGRLDISEDALRSLMRIKPSAAHYLIAYQMLQSNDNFLLHLDVPLNSDQKNQCHKAVHYLHENYQSIIQDGRTLYFFLKVWWLSKTGKQLFYSERQAVPFTKKDWETSLNLIEDIMATGELKSNSSLKYLLGLSNFHIDRIDKSLDIFKALENDSEKTGSRRIISSYLASTPEGKPKQYTGDVAWSKQETDKGQVYVNELRSRINFNPRRFNRPDIRQGESLGDFHIAFNFRGPIAEPISLYSDSLKKERKDRNE